MNVKMDITMMVFNALNVESFVLDAMKRKTSALSALMELFLTMNFSVFAMKLACKL
jgi:hypothetical protein